MFGMKYPGDEMSGVKFPRTKCPWDEMSGYHPRQYDDSEVTTLTLLDFSKAFDTVNHKL